MNLAYMRHSELRILAGTVWLDAYLTSPRTCRGLILCATPHLNPLRDSREDQAEQIFRDAGFATLLVSFLTPYETERDPDLRYNIARLHDRLQAVLDWIAQQPALNPLALGIHAADTLAGASIRLLAREPGPVAALVSRAGRADLAGAAPLRQLKLPLLMLLPESAPDLFKPSEQAYALMQCTKHWQIIPEADASFSQPGTLSTASQSACNWYEEHIPLPTTTRA